MVTSYYHMWWRTRHGRGPPARHHLLEQLPGPAEHPCRVPLVLRIPLAPLLSHVLVSTPTNVAGRSPSDDQVRHKTPGHTRRRPHFRGAAPISMFVRTLDIRTYTNHQSPIMRRTRAGVYFRSTSSCSHHGRHHQTSHGGADVTDVLFATYPTTSWPGLTRDPLGSACRVANTCAGGWRRRGDRRTNGHCRALGRLCRNLRRPR